MLWDEEENMFDNVKEETLDQVYDWISSTYYSPYPTWKPQSDGEYERAIHALNDMRSLYAGVGNNGWWEPERVRYLDELRDIIPYSMDQVLGQNAQISEYHVELENSALDDADFFEEYAPDIVKMQGNKDGSLYEYTKELFWESVEWFLDNYASDSERNEVLALIKT